MVQQPAFQTMVGLLVLPLSWSVSEAADACSSLASPRNSFVFLSAEVRICIVAARLKIQPAARIDVMYP